MISHNTAKRMYQLFTVSCLLAAVAGASLRGRHLIETSVRCRMMMVDTLLEDSTGEVVSNIEEIACAPILNGVETDDLVTVNLPDGYEETYRGLLEEGHLMVEITNAIVLRGDIAITPSTEFLVDMEASKANGRHLQENSMTIGNKTIAVVLIHTKDKSPSVTREDMEGRFDSKGINLSTQYSKCSGGKLQWRLAKAGVIDVHLDQLLEDYGTRGAPIVNAATDKLKLDLNIDSASSIADRVMFCAPKSAGSWVASAGMNHWRAQFHDHWCGSLTAAVHELGHTVGLLHSNKDGARYGDRTGNMARSFRTWTGPMRCFDGRSHHKLGWYQDRELTFNPLAQAPKRVDLAAFVDYKKTAANEPVLITLPQGEENIFIQYNRAKNFNNGTGAMKNQVTLTNMTAGGSNLMTGLSAGNVYEIEDYQDSGRTLVIEACYNVPGNNRNPDVMIISVGMDYSACVVEAGEKETVFPTSAPTLAPTAPLTHREKTSLLGSILAGLRKPKKDKDDKDKGE